MGRDPRRPRRSGVWPLVVALALGAVAGCGSDSPVPAGAEPPTAGSEGGLPVEINKIADLTGTLTGFTATSDGAELLVLNREGGVWRLVRRDRGDHVVPVLEKELILDISEDVSTLGERGAFSIELTPDDSSLLVNYTASDGAITIEQFPYAEGEPIDRAAARTLFDLPTPYSWHHGGDMAFDDAGDLLVGVGDLEFRNVGIPGPQDPDLLLGGILRIPGEVVADLDAVTDPGAEDMIARGLRNPWRLSIDRATGDLWIGEVGLDTKEEVNRIEAGDIGGAKINFGWPYFEGSGVHQEGAPADLGATGPVHERAHATDVCGMVSGFRYRGQAIPALEGRVVYADLCATDVRTLTLDADGEVVADDVVGQLPEPVVSFGEDHAGEIYGLGVGGGLYRLDPAGWSPGDLEQSGEEPAVPLTTVPRSQDDCANGIVEVMHPLSELNSLEGQELQTTMLQAAAGLEERVPALPPYLLGDGETVMRAVRNLSERLAEVGWNPTTEQLDDMRDDLLNGVEEFEGFPDAMARIVDSECG